MERLPDWIVIMEGWRNGIASVLNTVAVHESGHGGSNPSPSFDVRVAKMAKASDCSSEIAGSNPALDSMENCANQVSDRIANPRSSSDGCTGSNPVFSARGEG